MSGKSPLTNFINPTGLEARGGNIFVETVASGDAIEGAPGENGLGPREASTRWKHPMFRQWKNWLT